MADITYREIDMQNQKQVFAFSGRFSSWLNFFRWAAALFVVMGHLRNIVFVDYDGVQHKNAFVKAFYFVTGLGHEAVIIFFVISGLLVGGITLKRAKVGTIDYASFFIHRFSRIYVVLLPALIVGGILDFIGLHFLNQTGLYTHATNFPVATLNFSVNDRLTAESFFGSIFMLQPFFVQSFGSNGPLWSLSYEWWYYCIFATLLAFFHSKTLYGKLLLLATLAGFAAFLPLELILWMLIWLLGIGVLLNAESHLTKLSPLLAFSIFVCTIFLSRFSMKIGIENFAQGLFAGFIKDFLIGIGFSMLLLSLSRQIKLGAIETDDHPFLSRFNRYFAEFSYTTYLCHFPFLLFFLSVSAGAFNKNLKQQPTLTTLIYFFFALSCVYIYVYIFSRLTERYTTVVRKRTEACLLQKLNASVNIKHS